MLSETALLAGLGGLAGALMAVVVLPRAAAWLPDALPRTVEVTADARVLGFALLVTVATALLAGTFPAWTGARHGLASVLRDQARGSVASRGGTRVQSSLVVLEVALAFLLLAATGLLGRSLVRLLAVDPGFDRTNLVVAQLHLPERRYAEPAAILAFGDRVRERIAALPGVTAVALVNDAPFAGGRSAGTIAVDARNGAIEGNVDQSRVTDGYADALGLPVLAGRFFTASDRAGAEPVAVVSHALAERYWPRGDAVGGRVRDGGIDASAPWRTVIGVVGDVRHGGLAAEAAPRMYMPVMQHDEVEETQTLLVRFAEGALFAPAQLAPLVASLDPEVPLTNVARMDDLVSRSATVPRFRALLIGALALLAGILALAGLYGVVSFTVARRMPEFGIRIVLGARPRRVLREVVAAGLRLSAAGIAIGLIAALLLFRALDAFLFGIAPSDPATLSVIALLLLATAALAAWVPARRAARVDPLASLRHD